MDNLNISADSTLSIAFSHLLRQTKTNYFYYLTFKANKTKMSSASSG